MPRQCHACGPRELNNLREVEDEIAKPTGPLFTDCDTAADAECCRQLHYFPVEASTYFSDSVTGCADVCLALGRLGEDGSCMPNDPECAHKNRTKTPRLHAQVSVAFLGRCINWQTQENWPKKGNGQSRVMSVGAYCLCGPLDRSKLKEQSARIVKGAVRPADTTTTSISDVAGFDTSGRRLWSGVNSSYVAERDVRRLREYYHGEEERKRSLQAISTLNVETDIISTGTDTSTWTWDKPSISAGIDRWLSPQSQVTLLPR